MSKYSIIFLLLCALWTHGAEFTAVRATRAPKIDGKLDDSVWQSAPELTGFIGSGTKQAAKTQTMVKMLYDDRAVYIGIRCETGKNGAMKFKTGDEKDNINLYAGENIELMLDPGATRNVYYHFMTNPAGSRYDAKRDQGGFVSDPKWQGDWTVSSHIGKGFWSCEFRIPYLTLDILPGQSQDWGFNVARGSRDRESEDSALTPDGSYHVAGQFNLWKNVAIDSDKFAYSIAAPEVKNYQANDGIGIDVKSSIGNLSTRPRKVKIDCIFIAPDKSVGVKSTVEEIAPRDHKDILWENYLFKNPGDYLCEIKIVDATTKHTLKSKKFTLPIHFAPLGLNLVDPHYRNTIFASQNLDQVRYNLVFALPESELKNKKIRSGIRTLAGKTVIAAEKNADDKMEFAFDTAILPEEKLEIYAELLNPDGVVAAQITHPLRKLPYRKGEVFLGKDGYWYLDGKRFFMVAAWNRSDEIIPGCNAFADVITHENMKYVSFKPTNTDLNLRNSWKQPQMTPAQEATLRKIVDIDKENPELFAYYLNDEPEVFGYNAQGLSRAYDVIADVDPYHPIIISNDTLSGVSDFAASADINGLHAYPKVSLQKSKNDFAKVVYFMDSFKQFFKDRKHRQTMAWMLQGFNYGDYGDLNSRIPNYEEFRVQNLLSVILGGKGLLIYCRMVRAYPELYLGLEEHLKEVNAYKEVFIQDDADISLSLPDQDVRCMVKRYGEGIYLFAANVSGQKRTITLSSPEFNGQTFKVMAEGRDVKTANGRLSDTFDNFDVHVYTNSPLAPDLKTIAAIEAEIAAINAARVKPGNLAYQRYEHEKIMIAASSNAGTNRRNDNGLWHLTDGICGNPSTYIDNTQNWVDLTPNQSPDDVVMNFKQNVTVGRVVIYPLEKSINTYRFQFKSADGEWETIGEEKNCKADVLTSAFAPVTAKEFRLIVDATNGANVIVSEIELYSK